MRFKHRNTGVYTLLLLLISVILLSETKVQAQDFIFPDREESQIRNAETIAASGSGPFNFVAQNFYYTFPLNNGKYKGVHSYVRAGINHAHEYKVDSAYVYKIMYSLKAWDITNTVHSNISDSLTISYYPDSLGVYQDIHAKKYSNYLKMEITVNAIYDVTDPLSPPVQIWGNGINTLDKFNFFIEGYIIAQPYEYGLPTFRTVSAGSPVNDYLPVSWNADLAPSRYELEWTYVDNYDADTITGVPKSDLEYDFKHNSTRVWVDTTAYRIPLIYSRGYLIYRVRTVRPDSVHYKYPIYGPWSVATDKGTVDLLASGSQYFEIDSNHAHEGEKMNWQYTISFAEGGKYKHVMSYYDGLLKNRQSITRFNSNPDQLVVTENIYDYEGRPSIKILPTPVTSSDFHYQHGLSLNSLSGIPYRAIDFDTIRPAVCPEEIPIAPLASTALANIYYSSANPDTAGYQKFVPDAGGYPFVHTVYTPGYNDRIDKQGGAGDSLQIGYGHNSVHNYVDADQNDLNRHFGADIGWSGYYNKTVTTDPNDQSSMAVKDYKGQLVMTSLIGGPNTVDHPLVLTEDTSTLTFQQELIGTKKQQIIGNSKSLHNKFFQDVDGSDYIQYVFDFAPFPVCGKTSLSIEADYYYHIIDECGILKISNSGTLGVTGVVDLDSVEEYLSPKDSVYLKKGEHSLYKVLTVNPDDIEAAVDSFMKDIAFYDTCFKTEPEFIREEVESRTFPCPAEPDPCARKKAKMMQELWPHNKYGNFVRNSDGSIANIDTNSIFDYVDPVRRYQDTCLVTLPDSVFCYGKFYVGLDTMNADTFLKVYKAHRELISEALLPLHPEYCKLQSCFVDTFKERMLAMPSGVIAEQYGRLKLSDIIDADPVKSRLFNFGFASPEDSLSYLASGKINIDTLVTLLSYCGCTDSVMYKKCAQEIFKHNIDSLILVNDQVKNAYFKTLVQIYFQNRERFIQMMSAAAGEDSCGPCAHMRMRLEPDPVFPIFWTSSGAIDTTNPYSYWNLFGGDTSVTSISTYMQNMMNSPHDSLFTYQDSAGKYYNQYNALLCTGQVDSIIVRLANCIQGNTTLLNDIKSDLLDLCSSGQVQYGNYSPEQIHNILTANGVQLGDLCNPYVIGYNKLDPAAGLTAGGLSCKPSDFYTDIQTFLNKTKTIQAFTDLNVNKLHSLDPANSFEVEIKGALSNPPDVYLRAIYEPGDNLYVLKAWNASYSSDTVKIYLRGNGSGVTAQCNSIFANPGSANFAFTKVECIAQSPAAIGKAYIGNYAFTADIKRDSSGHVTTCKMLGWVNKVETALYTSNKLEDCIPCTEFRALYQDFTDTLLAYDVKGVDHPYYNTMLRNFMNHRIGKSFSTGQYLRFIESCAIADSMYLQKYNGYVILDPGSDTDAGNLISALNNIDATIQFPAQYTENGLILFNLNFIPKEKLYIYRDFLATYTPSTLKTVNQPLSTLIGPNYVGSVYYPAYVDTLIGSFPDWQTMLGPLANSFNFLGKDSSNIRIGGIQTKCYYYIINKKSAATPSDISRALYLIQKQIVDSAWAIFVLSNYQHTVDEDYFSNEKQEFLQYVYSMQGLPSGTVLDSLQEDKLNQYVTAFQTKPSTYTIPTNPGNATNLYVTDPTTSNGRLNILQAGLEYVANNNDSSTNSLFPTAASNIVTGLSSDYKAYRCSDGSYLFTQFITGDTMFNAYIRMPKYIPVQDHHLYKFISKSEVQPAPGDSTTRYFTVKLKHLNTQEEIIVKGMTDYVIGSNITLEDVLLGNPVTATLPAPDTFDNCEKHKIQAAIIAGKMRYASYVDSVRDALYYKFNAYVMDHLGEKLYLDYLYNRLQTVLYYYDRAGNLTKTVPPEGVNFLDPMAMPVVDSAREFNDTNVHYRPVHNKLSQYDYNSFNNVVRQKTPDGGTTDFYYDNAQRLIFSQNSQQRKDSFYTYNLYDDQSRIIETGQAVLPSAYVKDVRTYTHNDIRNTMYSKQRRDVVYTVYDREEDTLSNIDGLSRQTNLRKRVACVKYKELAAPNDPFTEYDHAVHYSYDIAGNVKTLTHDFPLLEQYGHRYKRIDYDYDVISGKVNAISYNRSFPDQYYQRYSYDADNRLTKVETSADGQIWMSDAEYDYYQHGPLARMRLGHWNVQGVDYAYTVQGWLKMINGEMLNAANDMGKDGLPNDVVAKDVFAMTLDYFPGDYEPIGAQQVSYMQGMSKGLYNGNISRKTTAIEPFSTLTANYTYDQLNRIDAARYDTVDVSYVSNPIAAYRSSYKYDKDGNIIRLMRMGNDQIMDTLVYEYAGNMSNNKLLNVLDYATDNYDNDIRKYTQTGNARYQYDLIGNVTKDMISGEDSIKWNLYNKVKASHDFTDKNNHFFKYDGAGNRIAKIFQQSTDSNTVDEGDYYIRDAQGNILAIYKSVLNYKWDKVRLVSAVDQYIFGTFGAEPLITDFIVPTYGEQAFFNDGALGYTLEGDDLWLQGRIDNTPLSDFLSCEDMMTRMLSGDAEYIDDVMTYGQSNFNIVGDAWQQLFAAGDDGHINTWINSVFGGSESDNIHILKNIMCPEDPAMLEDLAKELGFGTSNDCEEDATNAVSEIGHDGFFPALMQVYGDHTQSFDDFLAALATDATIVGNSAYTGAEDGLLVPLVQSSLNWYGNRTQLATFYDSYTDARDILYSLATNNELAQLSYYADKGDYLVDYITDHGGNHGFIDSTVAGITGLVLSRFLHNGANTLNINETVLEDVIAEELVLQNERFYLAEHHLYGSSRLGIKKYTPNQIYINKNFDQSQTNPEVDSTTFDFRLPWYSNQYQDIVRHLVDTLNGGMIDNTEGYLSHIIGQKQYELNNHLGNVQVVVSDNIVNYDYDNDSLIDEYHAAIPVAYDYYPFGSLMPGRYVQDTGKHCFTTMQTKTVWDWGPVFEPGDVSGWAADASWAVTGSAQKSSSTDVDGETVMLKLEAQTNGDGLVNEEVDSEPGVETEFVIAIGAAEGRFRAQVEEQIGSEWVTLDAVDIDREGEYLLTYTSETNNLKFSMKSTTGVSTYGAIYISEIRSDGLVPTQQQVPVQICSSVEDRYRFGFNGQEKDNEFRGIGNSLDFGERWMDTRTGRLGMSVDPLFKKYPGESPYIFAGDNPVKNIDKKGLTKVTYHVVLIEGYDKPLINRVTSSGLYAVSHPYSTILQTYDWYDYTEYKITTVNKDGSIKTSSSIERNAFRTNTAIKSEVYAGLKIGDFATKDGSVRDGWILTTSEKLWPGNDHHLNAKGRGQFINTDDISSAFNVSSAASNIHLPTNLLEGLSTAKDVIAVVDELQKNAPIDFTQCESCGSYKKDGKKVDDTSGQGITPENTIRQSLDKFHQP